MGHLSFYYGSLLFLLLVHANLFCVVHFLFERLPTSPPPSAYIQIDTDGDGKITEREFVNWTQGGEVTDLVEQRVGAP
jgi:hypothetical protein